MTSPSDLIERLSELRLAEESAVNFNSHAEEVAYYAAHEAFSDALRNAFPEIARFIRSTLEAEMPSEPRYFDNDGYVCERGVKPCFVEKAEYDKLRTHSLALTAKEAERAEAKRNEDAIRELMNVYNLGGWTDAIGPMKRALAAESEREAMRVALAHAHQWPDDLEAGFLHALEIAKVSGASDEVLGAMVREWERDATKTRSRECYWCSKVRDNIALRSEREAVSDDEIMRSVINECDTLDITRVSEMRGREWHATTIFDGDAALLRVVKKAISTSGGEKK